MRVFGSDEVNVNPKTTTNIHHPFYPLKTFVGFQNLLHNQTSLKLDDYAETITPSPTFNNKKITGHKFVRPTFHLHY